MRGTVRQVPIKRTVLPDGKTRVSGGTWWWQATLTSTSDGVDENGDPARVTSRQQVRRRGFATKKEAQAALTEFLAAHGKGDTRRALTQPSAQPLREYLADWLTARAPALKPSTREGYATVIRTWIEPLLGDVPLRALTGARISAWTSTLRERGGRYGRPLGTRSVAYSNLILGMALGDAVEAGLLPISPMLEVPKRQRPRHTSTQALGKVWDAEQARLFLDAVRDDRLFALWALALDSGARRGELLALRWDDLDGDVVTFTRNRVRLDSGVAEGTVKNAKPRIVDLDQRTVAALRTWRKTQLEERLAAGAAYDVDSAHMFTDELGQPLSPGGVSNRFDRIVAKLDIPRISLHGTRHTCGTILVLAGVPINVVAARLGHDPAILLRTYAHVLPQSGRDAADRIGAALYGTAT